MIFQNLIVRDPTYQVTRAHRLTRISPYLTVDDELVAVLIAYRYKGLEEVAQAAIFKVHIHWLWLPIIELPHDHNIEGLICKVFNF
jgi:hypothetical protein